MKVLALDTGTDRCSVAVGDGFRWHLRTEHAEGVQSERIMPMLDAVLSDAGWALSGMDGIAFGAGPGAFTGVRIGCAVAQGLALGADLPVVAVPTLDALALVAVRTHGWARVLCCVDARMEQVYTAAYARAADRLLELAAPDVRLPSAVELPAARSNQASDVASWYGAGNAFGVFPTMQHVLGLAGADSRLRSDARAIGTLAIAALARGEGVPAADAQPLYVRNRVALTTAERTAGARL